MLLCCSWLLLKQWAQSTGTVAVESICTEYLRRRAWEVVQQTDTEQAGQLLEVRDLLCREGT